MNGSADAFYFPRYESELEVEHKSAPRCISATTEVWKVERIGNAGLFAVETDFFRLILENCEFQ
jgi:hypothetical protein